MTDRPLTPKQQAFVAAYVGAAKGNATQAARMAGYDGNAHTLTAVGAENLAKPESAHAIEVFRLATHTTAIMTAEEAAERLSRIGRGDPELLEKRLSQSTMKQLLDENPDMMPPGVNVDSRYAVTIRRS